MDEAAVRITASDIEEISEALAGIGHSGAMLKYRTRNLEIRVWCLRTIPE
jgi:hypothetical protein